MTNPQPAQEEWRNKLYKMSEKYCKHDDCRLNSCLYYIFEPFIAHEISAAKAEERERVRKWAEGMKREHKGEETPVKSETWGYNQALSDLLQFLITPQEK